MIFTAIHGIARSVTKDFIVIVRLTQRLNLTLMKPFGRIVSQMRSEPKFQIILKGKLEPKWKELNQLFEK